MYICIIRLQLHLLQTVSATMNCPKKNYANIAQLIGEYLQHRYEKL